MNKFLELSIDNQAGIIVNLDFESLMSLLNSYPSIQNNESLWEKVISISKMSAHHYYMEHLIEQKNICVESEYSFLYLIFIFKNRMIETNITISNLLEPSECISEFQSLINHGDNHDFYELNINEGEEWITVEQDIVSFNLVNSQLDDGGNNPTVLKIPFKNCREALVNIVSSAKEVMKENEEMEKEINELKL